MSAQAGTTPVGGRGEAVMSERDFSVLGRFIQTHVGIKMPPAKRTMLEARLRKRLQILGVGSFREYCDRLFSPNGGAADELTHMIDAVTTNKTDFFREPQHFDVLVQRVLPALKPGLDSAGRNRVHIWSAGCSSGEEPYTLAMVLAEALPRYPGLSYRILATDISRRMLEQAAEAVYPETRIEPVPAEYRKKYLLRSRDKTRQLVRVAPELRAQITFRPLNFMDDDFGMREPFDVIFCRNVLIYFDRPTQERLLQKFCRLLVPGGFLFLGHSETINGLDVPVLPVAPTVYRNRA